MCIYTYIEQVRVQYIHRVYIGFVYVYVYIGMRVKNGKGNIQGIYIYIYILLSTLLYAGW